MKSFIALTGTVLAFALAGAASAVASDYRSSSSESSQYRSAEGPRSSDHRSSGTRCYKCPPSRNYDTQEVIKNSKEVDHTRTIETESVVPSKRLIETNHLVLHENETRNVGVIQHNHTIIEKELILTKRNVDHKYVNNQINLVENKYNTERKRQVEERELPGEVRHLRDCDCDTGSSSRRHQQHRGVHAYGQAPNYVSSRY